MSTDSVRLMGKEFYLVFPPLFYDGGDSYCVLYVVSTSLGFCTVALPILTKRYNLELKPGESQLFLPASYMALENQMEGKGVHIECNVYVNVYAAKHDKFTTTVFLVLPIHSRFHYEYKYIPSLESMPVSAQFSHLYNSTLAIVSSGDHNIVTVSLNLTESESIVVNNQTYWSNESIRLTMNKFESIVISHAGDLTGSSVSSIDPVFVATGNNCGRLKTDNACSGMFSVLPVDDSHTKAHFDTEHIFITPFFYPFLRGYKIRILSKTDNYRLQYIIGNESKPEVLFVQKDFVDIDVELNVPVFIRTSRFASVTVITPGKNNTDGIGVAFMLHVPEQAVLLSEYHFIVPDLNTTSYVTLISRNASQLRLDDRNVDGDSILTYDINAEQYEVIALPIQPGYHIARNVLKEPFSLYVYGKQKPSLGYGYVAGFNVRT